MSLLSTNNFTTITLLCNYGPTIVPYVLHFAIEFYMNLPLYLGCRLFIYTMDFNGPSTIFLEDET